MSTNPPEKKKSSCLAIGGFGCLIIILIILGGGVYGYMKFGPKVLEKWSEFTKDPERTAAMLILENIPDFEIIKVDEEKRLVTFKVKSSGEVATATFKAVAGGKISYVNGKADISGVERTDPAAAVTPAPVPAPAPATPAPQ